MGRNNADFHGVTFRYSRFNGDHFVSAKEPGEGQGVGYLHWSNQGGKINDIYVDPDWRRKGIATGMFDFARVMAESSPHIPRPRHSGARTEAGDAWSKTTKGYYLPTTITPDNEEQRG
jgi:GNAT superfamily N-acetyltransferase